MTSLQLANMTTVENSKKKYREEIREQTLVQISVPNQIQIAVFSIHKYSLCPCLHASSEEANKYSLNAKSVMKRAVEILTID